MRICFPLLIFTFFGSLSSYGQSFETLLDSALQAQESNMAFFEKAEVLIQDTQDQINFLIAQHKFFSNNNERENMLEVEKKLISLLQSENDNKELAELFYRIAYYYEVAGNYDQAIQYLFESLDYAKKSKDQATISFTYKSLSQNHRLFHDFDKAVEYGKLAYDVAYKAGDDFAVNQVQGLNIIGAAFNEMNLPDSTLSYYTKVLDLLPVLDSMTVAPTIANIAYAYLLSGDIEQSRKYNNAALNLYRKTNNNYAIGIVFVNSAMTENQAKNYSLALAYLDSGINYTEKTQYAEMYKWIYEEQYKIHKALGRYEEAMNSLSNLLTIKDSLFNTERAQVAKDLEIKYQTALKDQEIKEQEKEISESRARFNRIIVLIFLLLVIIGLLGVILMLSRSRFKKKQELMVKEKELEVKEAYINAALESQESERKRFAQDLHDGLGQLISALRLNISRLGTKNETLETKIAVVKRSEIILQEMHTEIRNIAFNLMPSTLIQYGLKESIREFAQRINQSGKIFIETDIYGLEERLTEIQEISIYRVIQEWTNNVIKYAEAKRISIQLVSHETSLSIIVEDDGKGFNKENLENTKGNGWRNIQSRLKRVSATWELDTQSGRKGTTLMIDIPLTKAITPQEPRKSTLE
jgi:two-component system, NarL family, sensor kinase